MSPHPGTSGTIEFGRFKVLLARRELLVDGRPTALGARAFDVLMALIDARGAVLTKDELMTRVWDGRVVEENSLQAQISALRRAFAEQRDLIRTVAGRGYLFAGEIRPTATDGSVDSARSRTNLPERLSELIGREAEVGEVVNLVNTHRLVTLVGAGGIGKTRLAVEVARNLAPGFADGAWVADLGPVSDPGLVPVTVADALGLSLAGGAVSLTRVATALSTRHILLVLDNCEHLIDIAARMAESMLRGSSGVSMIATSREALRVEGERNYRVPPLGVPLEAAATTDDPSRAGAVKLFVVRAREASPDFTPDDRTATIVGAICRRLDGMPLAIELAAARTAAFGIDGVAARLDDRFRILTAGLRTALPRHQTLRATLDWSYELLPEVERIVLRRLGVFAGSFPLELASKVVAGDRVSVPDAADHVANLVAKSLVGAEGDAAGVTYRLLETTRTYALEKLIESGELDQLSRRHADHYRALFEGAEAEWETRPTAEWFAAYRSSIFNLRSALDWSFAPGGDAAVGLALTVTALPLWFHLSLIDEARKRVESAIATLEHGASVNARRQMQLYWGLGWSLMYTAAPARETGAAWASALELAQSLDDTDYRLRALWGLWAGRINNGEFREARALAEKFRGVAQSTTDANDVAVAQRMVGVALHFLGDQVSARWHIEQMLTHYVRPVRRSDVVRFQFDQRVTAQITLARVLWLQGFADRAMRTIESSIEEALSLNHTLSLCNVLAQAACPLALLAGDLAAAERFLSMFLHHTAAGLALDVWHTYGRGFEGMLLIKRGRADIGLPLLRAAIEQLREARFSQYHTTFSAALAEGFGEASRVADGIATIDQAHTQAERNDERWNIAELLRVKGELVLLGGAPNGPQTAEQLFLQSIESARAQGALAWELRSGMSLARVWHAHGRTSDARELLAPAYARFAEGFGTADLQAAKTMIEALE